MILILTRQKRDVTCNRVISELNQLGANFRLFNVEELLEVNFNILEEIEWLSQINVVWYNRFSPLINGDNYQVNAFLTAEFNVIKEFFLEKIPKHAIWFPYFKNIRLNKLSTLRLAKEVGLNIPETHILSSLTELEIISKNKQFVSKAISETQDFLIEGRNFSMYAETISSETISDNLPNEFYPSIIQERINAHFEIRSYYLDGEFYSSGICFESTEIDFRKFYEAESFKLFPVNLPENVKYKLKNLMERLGLTTGSIDLMYDVNDKYYFLEVNPVGQFSMITTACGSNLEKKLALTLYSYDN